MNCHYCGAQIGEGTQYCLNCGTRQELRQPEQEVHQKELHWVDDLQEAESLQPVAVQVPAVAVTERAAEQEFPVIKPTVRREAPRLRLPIKRGLGKMFFLGILTLGIYPTVIWSRIVTELNLAASRYDGKRTMPYFAMVMLAPITLGIFAFVWMHKFCRRIGDELNRRNLDYEFGPGTFWLWNILGCLILVGPFVFCHKLMKAMNRINADFNING